MTIFHQNVQSLGNKKLNFEILTANNTDLDILCITEHWLRENDFVYFNLTNFVLVSKFCRKNKKHGGSCIFVKSSIEAKPITKFESICIEENFEASMMELTDLKIVIICIYRTPNSNILLFIENLDIILKELTKKKNRIIILGDFNIDFLGNTINFQFQSVLSSYDLHAIIDEPTRIGKDSQSAFDQIILNTSLWHYNCEVIDMGQYL